MKFLKIKLIFKCENDIHEYLNCLLIISFLNFKLKILVVYLYVFLLCEVF